MNGSRREHSWKRTFRSTVPCGSLGARRVGAVPGASSRRADCSTTCCLNSLHRCLARCTHCQRAAARRASGARNVHSRHRLETKCPLPACLVVHVLIVQQCSKHITRFYRLVDGFGRSVRAQACQPRQSARSLVIATPRKIERRNTSSDSEICTTTPAAPRDA